MSIFDYIPEIYNIPTKLGAMQTILIRKRIFHPGWQISYKVEKYSPDDSYWVLYANVASKEEAIKIINTISKDKRCKI